MTDMSPLLADIMPSPRELTFDDGGCSLRPTMRLYLPLGAGDGDRRTATLLAETIREATGLRLRAAETTRYVRRHVIWIGADGAFDIPPEFVPPHHEGFALRVARGGILLAGTDAAGLRYAALALGQILRLRRRGGRRVPAFMLQDWPELRWRGVMLDNARQVERPDFIDGYVRDVAAWRKNMFVLYFEDKFRWHSRPELSHPLGYSAEDFARLSRTAAEHHVEFVPALPCLGHCEGVLRHEEIAHLREDGAIYQLALREPGTRDLLRDQIDEVLDACPGGRFFHANCDESPLLGGAPGSPPSYLRESLRLFTDHLVFLHDLLARRGRRMMIWGDMLLHYPQVMRGLPRDILIVDWDYGSMGDRRREAPRLFREQGFDVIVAPAAGRSAEVYYAPLMQMGDNIPHFVRQGRDAGAVGVMTTMWEMRPTTPIGMWQGVVASAQAAWNPDAMAADDLSRRVAANLHGPEAAGAAVRAWGHVSAEAFSRRFRQEMAEPELPGVRTYHLDSHEFVATDPMVYLTYEPTPWADEAAAAATRGAEEASVAQQAARWNADLLGVAELAGRHQTQLADRRRVVNLAARAAVEAERLRRAGNHRDAAARVREAAELLADLAARADRLIRPTVALWRQSRHADDPALERIHLRRLRRDRAALRGHVHRLQRIARDLAAGRSHDLSNALGGQAVLVLEAEDPSCKLLDILHVRVSVDQAGRGAWRVTLEKPWFMLARMRYLVPLILGRRLPRGVRVETTSTQINPQRFPLAERFHVSAAQTLTVGEIVDGPPETDIRTTDWRLVRTPQVRYELVRREGWALEYALQK